MRTVARPACVHCKIAIEAAHEESFDRDRYRHWVAPSPGCLSRRAAARLFSTTRTHDYKRNGATTLFAALDTATGEVYGLRQQKHRHQEWLRFLRMIDQTIPSGKDIYLICDNDATHKHERVQHWLSKHKRFHVHFTPTSASWLNMVERFFRDPTRTGSGAESFATSNNSSWLSENTSTATMEIQSPSSGQQRTTTSWKESLALRPHSIKDDLLETLR